MRPGVAFVPFVMVAVVLLAGCSGSTSGSPTDPGSSGDPMSAAPTTSSLNTPATTATSTSPPASASTVIPADVPTAGPNLLHKGERPPVMPELATEHTPAGAVAFAKFFIRTIDWGFATTSGAYMRHYFTKSCIECASHADGLDNTHKARHHYLGGRFTITDARRVPASHAEASVVVTFDLTSVVVLDKGNGFISGDKAVRNLKRQLGLDWKNSGWLVADMHPVS